MANDTIGYSLGVLENYFESLLKDGQTGAQAYLDHLKNIETKYTEKAEESLVSEEKLRNIQMNLEGWKRI